MIAAREHLTHVWLYGMPTPVGTRPWGHVVIRFCECGAKEQVHIDERSWTHIDTAPEPCTDDTNGTTAVQS